MLLYICLVCGMTTRNRHTQLIHICLPVFRYMGICCFFIFLPLRTATAPNDRHIAYLTITQHPHLRVFILELRNALKRHALVFICLRNASVFTHLTFTCLKPPASPSHRLQHGRHMPGKRSFGPLLPTTGSLPPHASLFRAVFFFIRSEPLGQNTHKRIGLHQLILLDTLRFAGLVQLHPQDSTGQSGHHGKASTRGRRQRE